ncbi:phytanoyl-CoA dioxygenase family protein [Caballeronia sp. LZ001]|uniref:phytanoyl-CoA dioxygenase family protein n=1 Tax=Caballeronia sp. LZ001 TaxID=3038553 RepID=UPI00285B7DB9|nr:phytanoyl-CoA dioxygenase family protein [Caballeronia sp. LZ001]MDR5805906.1 phytanoyl-CoA dioxygenase family protein [Caballeronia sp. LZ001]
MLPHGPIGGDPSTHGLECVTGFNAGEAVVCPLELGDCTIHAGRTLHFAGPNHSDAPRYAYSMVFGLPRRASKEVRSFPWNDNRRLSRQARVNDSRTRDSFWPYLSRKVREFDYTNPYEWRLGAERVARLIKGKRTAG